MWTNIYQYTLGEFMSLTSFEFWFISGLITLLIIVIGYFLSILIGEVKKMGTEMTMLNEKIAIVVTNQDWHKMELARLDSRISKLEHN